MDLTGRQIQETYGNLVTVGTVAGTPTTGTVQNGAGSDVTDLTVNGTLNTTTVNATTVNANLTGNVTGNVTGFP